MSSQIWVRSFEIGVAQFNVGAHEMRPKKAGVFHTPLQEQLNVKSNLGAEF